MINFIVSGGDPSLIMPPSFGTPTGPARGAPGQFPQFPQIAGTSPTVLVWAILLVALVLAHRVSLDFQR